MYENVIENLVARCGQCCIGQALLALRRLNAPAEPGSTRIDPHQPTSARPRTRRSKAATADATAPAGEKACKKCGQIKPLDAFPKNKECADGRLGSCKACVSERAQKNYIARTAGEPNSKKPYSCKCGKTFRTKFVCDEHKKKCTA